VTTVASALAAPSAVAVDGAGVLYIATSGDGRIRELRDGMLRVLVNADGVLGDADGPGPSAALRPMEGLVADGSTLWIADTANNRVRRLSLADDVQLVTSVTGPDPAAAEPDKAASSLPLLLPRGIAPFDSGYAVADSAHHRIVWLSRELAPASTPDAP
jgi:hypothetical protein